MDLPVSNCMVQPSCSSIDWLRWATLLLIPNSPRRPNSRGSLYLTLLRFTAYLIQSSLTGVQYSLQISGLLSPQSWKSILANPSCSISKPMAKLLELRLFAMVHRHSPLHSLTCSACIAIFSLFSCLYILQIKSSIHVAFKHLSQAFNPHPNPTQTDRMNQTLETYPHLWQSWTKRRVRIIGSCRICIQWCFPRIYKDVPFLC